MYYTSKKTTVSIFGGFIRKVEYYKRDNNQVGYSWKVFWIVNVYAIQF